MPVPARSLASTDGDAMSMFSQTTSTMTIGDSLSAQLVRKTARKGLTFNIMSVGPQGLGKTTLLSALFGRNLDFSDDTSDGGDPVTNRDTMNPPVKVATKTFDIDDKKVRLKLTLVISRNYGEALSLQNAYLPLVQYIDEQFANYHKRESSRDRRNIQDTMVHCMFFFISPIGHGLSKLDLEFLKSIQNKVNVIPIISKAEALTASERASFKQRVIDDLNKHGIQVYQMPDPDPEDSDDIKRDIKDIQEAMPFAVSSMTWKPDHTITDRDLGWAHIDPYNKDHSDFLVLRNMLHMQMPDLCDATKEIFYEEYRIKTENEKERARNM